MDVWPYQFIRNKKLSYIKIYIGNLNHNCKQHAKYSINTLNLKMIQLNNILENVFLQFNLLYLTNYNDSCQYLEKLNNKFQVKLNQRIQINFWVVMQTPEIVHNIFLYGK